MSKALLLVCLSSIASAKILAGNPWPTSGSQSGEIHVTIDRADDAGCLNVEGRWILDSCDTFTVESLGETDQSGEFALSIKNSKGETCFLDEENRHFTCGASGSTAWSVVPANDPNVLAVNGDVEGSTFKRQEDFLPDSELSVGVYLSGGYFDDYLYWQRA